MERIICPRCQEPFGRDERFCKTCGIRKSRSLSKVRWWLSALFVDVILTGIFTGIREKVITANGYAMDLSNGSVWLILGVVFMLILLPTLCVYALHFFLVLRTRGVMTQGTVVENYIETVERDNRRETRQMSAVMFIPEVAHPPQCRVTTGGWLTPGSMVDVLYDPYNPGEYARVGKTPSLAIPIVFAILGLGMAALAIFVMGALLTTSPGVYM